MRFDFGDALATDRDHRVHALAELLRTALGAADALGLTGVGLRLDQALVELTGDGITPPLTERATEARPCVDQASSDTEQP